MKLENLRIIVDERERKSGIPDLLKAIGMRVEMKTLPIGDYIVAPETIVERKSIKDLMASVLMGDYMINVLDLKNIFNIL